MLIILVKFFLSLEYGSGSSVKTRILLDHLVEVAGYVPIDISREHLHASARALNEAYPDLEVLPVCADFTQPISAPTPRRSPRRHAVYFPGSTIGNFTDDVDPYDALTQIAPYSVFVHAKFFTFDADGESTDFDLPRILRIFDEAGYNGTWGIEYEGETDDHEGVVKSIALMNKYGG